jgi:hypothetical protein
MDSREEHRALVADRTRRGFLQRAGLLGAGTLILSATPLAQKLVADAEAQVPTLLPDATLQAFADTMIPGRPATRTDLGDEIHPQAIAGVDPEPGAVEADALRLYNDPLIGFPTLAPPFLADLNARAVTMAGQPFLLLDFERRTQVALSGLAYDNPNRALWEAGAAVPFTAFCAAATQPNATSATASGYRVMGLPGTAPGGYRNFSYRRKLARERTKRGYLG